MTIQYIHQDSEKQTRDELPLLRNWCKDQIKEKNDPYEKPLQVRCLKVSKSGEWVIVEMDVAVALVNTGSELGSNLEELITQLKGEGSALVIIPHKKGKLGFSVGLDTETTVFYKFDTEEEYLWITNKHVPPTKPYQGLSASDILKPSPPTHPLQGDDDTPLSKAVANDVASARKRAPKAS